MAKWTLLLFWIPRTPDRASGRRTTVWRHLRQSGARLLQNGAWILPATPEGRAHFARVAAAVADRGGTALVFDAELAGGDRELLFDPLALPVARAAAGDPEPESEDLPVVS